MNLAIKLNAKDIESKLDTAEAARESINQWKRCIDNSLVFDKEDIKLDELYATGVISAKERRNKIINKLKKMIDEAVSLESEVIDKSEEAMKRRQESMDYANASVALSGIIRDINNPYDLLHIELDKLVVEGKISTPTRGSLTDNLIRYESKEQKELGTEEVVDSEYRLSNVMVD